jgi:hypothetical protein
MPIDFAQIIAAELGVQRQQTARSIELFDGENTVPFVARYRKEVTGGLDEAQLRTILERLTYLRHLEARKETVLKSIEEQGKLTDELRQRISHLVECPERVLRAVSEESGSAKIREMGRSQSFGLSRRMQRVRRQQERVNEAVAFGGEHRRLTAAVRLASEIDAAGGDFTQR